ncbi:MAG: hypothetical protein JWM05_1486 [Acidimicrobiales bacterium]|nr:hypothetical protein [Acidimicrobiales bacterium]
MSGTPSRRIIAAAVALALVLAGCGKKDVLKGDVVKDAAPCGPAEIKPSSLTPPSTPAKPTTQAKQVVRKDLVVGKGCPADTGKYLKVQSVGQLAKTGAVFDSTWTSNQPIDFKLGGGQVIQGWEEGLVGMKVGGRRLLEVPAALAYGKDGLKPKIGANQPLQFVVDLLGVYDTPKCKPPTKVPAATGKPTVTMPDRGALDLKTTDLRAGTGAAAKTGSYLTLQYVGIACSTGEQFDASWDTKKPFNVTLGQGGIIPGWEQGLLGMKAGGRRQLDIPSDLAYGAQGSPPKIGPSEPLTFVIDLLKVEAKPPTSTIPPAPSTTKPGATTTTKPSGSTTTAKPSGSTTTTTKPSGTTTTTAKPGTTTTTK